MSTNRALKLISWITLAAFLPAAVPHYAFATARPSTAYSQFNNAPTYESQLSAINAVADKLADGLITVALLDQQLAERRELLDTLRAAHPDSPEAYRHAEREWSFTLNARLTAQGAMSSARDDIRNNFTTSDHQVRDSSKVRFHSANILNFLLGRNIDLITVASSAAGAGLLTTAVHSLSPNLAQTSDPMSFVTMGLLGIYGSLMGATVSQITQISAERASARLSEAQVLSAIRTRLVERGLRVPDVLTYPWIRAASDKGLYYATILHNPSLLQQEITNIGFELLRLNDALLSQGLHTQAQWALAMLEELPSLAPQRSNARELATWAEPAALKLFEVRNAIFNQLSNPQEFSIPLDLAHQTRAALNAMATHQDGIGTNLRPDFRFHRTLRIVSALSFVSGDSYSSANLHSSLQSPELITLLEALAVEGRAAIISLTDHADYVPETEQERNLPRLRRATVTLSIYQQANPERGMFGNIAESKIIYTVDAPVVFSVESGSATNINAPALSEALRPVFQNLARSAAVAGYRSALCNAHLTLPPAQQVRVDVGTSAPTRQQEQGRGQVHRQGQSLEQREDHELEQPRGSERRHTGIAE